MTPKPGMRVMKRGFKHKGRISKVAANGFWVHVDWEKDKYDPTGTKAQRNKPLICHIDELMEIEEGYRGRVINQDAQN